MFSTVWTIRSAIPCYWGYIGELVTRSTLKTLIKCLNSAELSVNSFVARDAVFRKVILRWLITADDVVLISFLMTGNLLY